MLVDTHVHFDGLIEHEPAGVIIERAAGHGVDKMIAVGGSAHGNKTALAVANEHRTRVRAAIGFDRNQSELDPDLDNFEKMLDENDTAAVGEIGLDFHHERPAREAQVSLFRLMLAIARQHSLPVIVHNREADNDVIEILAEHVRLWPGSKDKIGVCHCFTGTKTSALRFLELGLHISFSGIITFYKSRSAELMEAARLIPDDRLLIETDAPFLAPDPLRGKSNEPANVRHVAKALAEIRGCSFESLAAVTTQNAERLFFNE